MRGSGECHTLSMTSEKSPLVLMHGILMSGAAWKDVVPLLAGHHEVHTPTTAGHRGGHALNGSPATVSALVDDMERYLDDHGLRRPHLAGLSLGGWMAIELARRGRAATVCALAPGGFWSRGDYGQRQAKRKLHRNMAMGRLALRARPTTGLALKSGVIRRTGFRDIAVHADRITAAHCREVLDDMVGCTLNVDDIIDTREHVSPLDPLPCPVTIAWAEKDALIPQPSADNIARERLPRASFTTMPGVGHVPMIDDPALVARTILAVTTAGS